MSEPFIGEIRMFGGNFAPTGWALCDGELLPISSYSALFSLLGTTYGGNGETTFGLPDLRGRVPMHAGAGPGLSPYNLGQSGGAETVFHSHTLATGGESVHGHELIGSSGGSEILQTTVSADAEASAANGTSPSTIQPYLTVNFIIALVGLYPSRS